MREEWMHHTPTEKGGTWRMGEGEGTTQRGAEMSGCDGDVLREGEDSVTGERSIYRAVEKEWEGYLYTRV